MKKMIVSACLAGELCRYDGGHNRDERIVSLVEKGEAVPVCPEVLGGLSTPRKPNEILHGRVVTRDGEDVTEFFARGAGLGVAVAIREGCTQAVLQPRSPSCGCGKIYDGSFRSVLVAGDGLFASALKQAGIMVLSIEEWNGSSDD